MVELIVKNEYSKRFVYKRLFNDVLKKFLEITKVSGNVQVELLIVSQEDMKQYYKKYKGKDKSTDVLSFPGDWKELEKIVGYKPLGDIIISYEHVQKQAKEYNHSLKREWTYLFVHALLHLIGYDHVSEDDENKMNKVASVVMEEMRINR